MKKALIIISVLIGAVFLSGCGKQAVQDQPAPPTQIGQEPVDVPAINQGQNFGDNRKQCPDGSAASYSESDNSFTGCENYDLANLDPELWAKHTDSRLGFSLMIPKFNFPNGKEGEKYPVQVMENNDGIKIRSAEMEAREDDGSWIINIKKIENDSDFADFMNEVGRNGCKLYRKDPSLQPGVYDVTVVPDATDTENLCGGMSAYVLKYYPEKGLAAYWDMGQDNSFLVPLDEPIVDDDGIAQVSQGADQIMAVSFEFIK
jgi:hypothetical protein